MYTPRGQAGEKTHGRYLGSGQSKPGWQYPASHAHTSRTSCCAVGNGKNGLVVPVLPEGGVLGHRAGVRGQRVSQSPVQPFLQKGLRRGGPANHLRGEAGGRGEGVWTGMGVSRGSVPEVSRRLPHDESRAEGIWWGPQPHQQAGVECGGVQHGVGGAHCNNCLALGPRAVGEAREVKRGHPLRVVLPEAPQRWQVLAQDDVVVHVHHHVTTRHLAQLGQQVVRLPPPPASAPGAVVHRVGLPPVGRKVVQRQRCARVDDAGVDARPDAGIRWAALLLRSHRPEAV
eukprot:scaffold1367_cov104-Isochrysis_galbana.AAC.4